MNLEDVRVYKSALELSGKINRLIKSIPYYWRINQSDQILRSSSSVAANIAEGFSRRFYPRDFIRFLIIALGSSDESQNHLYELHNKKCISENEFNDYFKAYKDLSIKILNLVNHLKKKHHIVI